MERTRKPKPCSMCSVEFMPTGQNQKRCDPCRDAYWDTSVGKKRMKEYVDKSRKAKFLREGRQFGVGTGHAQGKGEDHHSYKTGIGVYRQFKKDSCERCGSTKFLCVHHKDHDRHNNVPKNVETLCKSCHQREHNCGGFLPKGEEHNKRMSELATRMAPLRTRNAKGQFTNDRCH